MKNRIWLFTAFLLFTTWASAQTYLLAPDRIFDGERMQEGWVVLVEGDRITAVGKKASVKAPASAERLDLKGMTLMPGIIEGHAHLLLHPYNETSWNDQVLKESHAERVLRAGVHAEKSLMAGITTLRDLGTEGAGYVDKGIKDAIEKGVIPGPRLIISGPAIVASGSYGPKGFAPHVNPPLGAEPADGVDLVRVTRTQIGHGADMVKVYADYRWGPHKEARPTFSLEEIQSIVRTAQSSGRYVAAHAATAEGMTRAIMAGVRTIEHGDGGNPAVFQLMVQRGVALCPTIAAGEAISMYRGWKKGQDPDPDRVVQKKKSFQQALEAGVIISFGGDVGVFTHGRNVWEMELMVEYGMKPLAVLQSATSVNADVFELDQEVGRIKRGLLADLIAVKGNPLQNMAAMYEVEMVMLGGELVKQP
ncbi:MAG: amidohydrolase family protein [Bacteroidota bacterium]